MYSALSLGSSTFYVIWDLSTLCDSVNRSFFVAESYSIVGSYQGLFIPSFTEEYLACFQFGVIPTSNIGRSLFSTFSPELDILFFF